MDVPSVDGGWVLRVTEVVGVMDGDEGVLLIGVGVGSVLWLWVVRQNGCEMAGWCA